MIAKAIRTVCESLETRRLLASAEVHFYASGTDQHVTVDLDEAAPPLASSAFSVLNLTQGVDVPMQTSGTPTDMQATYKPQAAGPLPSGWYEAYVRSDMLDQDEYEQKFSFLSTDFNGSGAVDFNDFLTLQANFGLNPATFAQGDANYNGTVDYTDYTMLNANFGHSLPSLPGQAGGVVVGNTTAHALDVGWTAAADARDGFKVYRSDDDGATYALVQTLPDADARAWQDSGTNDDLAAPLVTGHKYWYRVRAFTLDAGASASVARASGIPVDAVTASPFSASASPSTVAPNAPFTLTLGATAAAAPGVTAWKITWADGQTQTLTAPPDASDATGSTWTLTHAYTAPGPHFILVQAQDAAGWHAPLAATVTVTNAPPQVSGTASYTTGGTTAALSVTGIDDGGSAHLIYQWSVESTPEDGSVTLSPNNSHVANNTIATFNEAGEYDFIVTTTDALGLTSDPFEVTVDVQQTPTRLRITPTSATLNLNDTRQFTATVTDQFRQPIDDPAVVWTADHGTIDSSGIYTAPETTSDGTDTVHAAVTGTILSPVVAHITLHDAAPTVATGPTASPNPVTGTTTALSVLGADDGGEGNLLYRWSSTGPAPVTFSGTPDTNGEKTATATFTQPGSYTFTAAIQDAAGHTTLTPPIAVEVVSTAAAIHIDPPGVTLPLHGTQAFTASVVNQFGSLVNAAPVTWQKLSGPGTLSGSTYTASATAGSAVIQASSGYQHATASVTISNQAPQITGQDYYTTPDTAIDLSVTGTDDGGAGNLTYNWAAVSLPDGASAPSFSANGNHAASQTTATFNKAGNYALTVTASDGSLSTEYDVTVDVEQTAYSVSVSPRSANLNVGETQQFTATVPDQFGDEIDGPDVTWTADHGTIDANGLYTATGGDGQDQDTVLATINGANDSAQITITMPAPGGLSATAPNPTEANLTWSDNSEGESSFRIERYDDDADTFVPFLTTPPNATGWSVIGLTPDTDYQFRVVAAGALESDPVDASVHTPESVGGPTVEWEDDTSSGSKNDHPSGKATVSGLIPGNEYHVSIGFNAVGTWDGSGQPRTDGIEAGPDSFTLEWNGAQVMGGTVVSSGNVGYYNGVNADYVDTVPTYDEDFTASQSTETVDVSTSLVDPDWAPYEGWSASVTVTDASAVPTVSIAPADEPGSAEAWEVPLSSQQNDTLKFTVSRSGDDDNGDLDQPLTVKLHPPAGTAIAGDDYSGFANSVTIPAHQNSTTVTLTAQADDSLEENQTVALCLKADADYRLGAFTSDGTINDTRIDLAIDSNNDSLINETDDSIEADPSKPGKYIDIDNYDTDGDFIPGFADGFPIAGKSTDHNTDAGNQFTPIEVTIPAGADLDLGTLDFTYGMSEPTDVFIPNSEATHLAEPFDYHPSTTAAGGLRIWMKNGNLQRNADEFTSVDDPNGGDFIVSGDVLSLHDLGFTSSKRTITLFVEAVDRNEIAYFTPQWISVSYQPDPAGPQLSDSVDVTSVYNPDGWRAVQRGVALFKSRHWNINSGFAANVDNLRAIYNYYGHMYNRSKDPTLHNAGAGRLEWAGLAKVAGQSVIYTDSHLENPLQFLTEIGAQLALLRPGLGVLMNQGIGNVINSMTGTGLLQLITGTNTILNLQAHLAGVLSDFLDVSFRIFNNVGWQLQAYQTAGLKEMERIGDLDLPVFPGHKAAARGALVDLVDAWTLMDNPQSNRFGNKLLITHEQKVVAQPIFDQLAGPLGNPRWMIDPNSFGVPQGITVSDSLTIGSVVKEPYSGALTMLEWSAAHHPGALLTNGNDRFDYFANYLWPTWFVTKTQAQRDSIINEPLP